jgi:hypothetical protein
VHVKVLQLHQNVDVQDHSLLESGKKRPTVKPSTSVHVKVLQLHQNVDVQDHSLLDA